MEGHCYVFYRMVQKSVKIKYQDDGSIGLSSYGGWFLEI